MRLSMESSVDRVLHSRDERVVRWLEGQGESAVHGATIDVDAKVHFHDALLMQNRFIAGVRGIVVCIH